MKLANPFARLRGGARGSDKNKSKGALATLLAGLSGRPRAVLLLAEDALGLTAVAASRGRGGTIALGEPVRVDRPVPTDAAEGVGNRRAVMLAEALQAFRERHGRPPRRAAVVSAAGLAAAVDLPVDPGKPRPPVQMLEMARYELEPAIAHHNGLWTLGEVLAARGVLDPEGRRRVAVEMSGSRAGPADGSLRFGETAIALGLAGRDEIDAALAVQHELQILDSEVACGWRGASARGADGHAAPFWLAAGLSGYGRADWLAALADAGLQPAGFWPRAGLAASRPEVKGHTVIALEVWPEQVVRLRLADGKVAGLASEARLEQTATPEWLADLLTEWLIEPIDRVVLLVADARTDAAALAAALQPLLRTEVAVAAATPDEAAARVWSALAAEALADTPAFVAVPARDPRPPFLKRPGVRGRLAGAAAVLALLAWEGHAWWNIQAMERERAALSKKLESASSSAVEGQALQQEAKELDLKANALRGMLAQALARADMLELLDRRLADVPDLIRALGRAIDPEVVLESIRESTENDPRIGIEVRAWSPSDGKAQAYAAQVQGLVAGNGMSVAQTDLRRRSGRDGVSDGYEVSFWLVPTVEQEEEAPAEPATAAKPQEARP